MGEWHSLSGMKILIVDDFPDTTEALAILLRAHGATTRQALTGEAALTEAAAFEPHVVLLDIDLPDMSGIRVCKLLHHMHLPQLPRIIAISGWEYVNLCDQLAGFEQFFAKPLDMERLYHALETPRPDGAIRGAAPGHAGDAIRHAA